MNTKLKGADMCAGLGSFHLAMNRAGHEIVTACEINNPLKKLYERNYGIKCHGDIYKMDVTEMPDFDVLFGGVPCQSFAVFGKRLGLNDPRGQLFKRMLEICQAKRPEWVVLENVANLIHHNRGRTLNIILRHFENLGYSMNYSVLCPTDLGIPQIRNRVFIIGRLGGTTPAVPVVERKPCPDLRSWLVGGASLSHNQLFADAIDEWKSVTSNNPQQKVMCLEDYVSPSTVAKYLPTQRTLYMQSPAVPFSDTLVRWESRGIVSYPSHVSPTLQHASPPAVIVSDPGKRFLSTQEAAALQSFPHSMLDGLSIRQKYAALGNGINVKCAETVVACLGKTAGSSLLTEE